MAKLLARCTITIYISGSEAVVRVPLVVRGRPRGIIFLLHIIMFAVDLILFIFRQNAVKCKLLLL